jgi:hypothetical protein
MTQVPDWLKVTVVPTIEHTPEESVLKVTGRCDVAVAVTSYVSP